MNIRARYERKKKQYLQGVNENTQKKNRDKAENRKPEQEKKHLEHLRAHPEKLKITRNGKVNRTSVRIELESAFPDETFTDSQGRTYAEKYELLYPTEFSQIPS